MSAMAPLEPLRLPLQGVQLIEASAGTGKTWTLAALYLRLVLGHGGQPPRLPAQILVVTFTRAATAELRERIRERLANAAAAFRGKHHADDFLRSLIGDYPDPDERSAAARQLELAAQWMDEAAVYTIHGWCQRMLAQHAFEGRDPADAVADENARLAEAVRDYWRHAYADLDAREAACIARHWADPQALQQAIRPLLRLPADRLRVAGRPLPTIDDLANALRLHAAPKRKAERLARERWSKDADAIEEMLRIAVKNKALKNNIYKPDLLERYLVQMRAWSGGEEADDALLDRYAQKKLSDSISKGVTAPSHPAFEALQDLQDARNDEPPLEPLLLAHAMPWIADRIEAIRQRQAVPGFDDMLRLLEQSLHGPHGAQLAETLATVYPVAMIDEFQDTDPLQWRIFQRVYAGRSDTGLLLIGDPKQAIYGFRGADIHTYLHARDQAASPTWTLTTNYRSSHALVQAVNRVFAHADRQPHGAFAFGKGEHGLPFSAVQDHGLRSALRFHGKAMPALLVRTWPHDGIMSGGAYRETSAAYAAAHIVAMLEAAASGQAAFVDADGAQTMLRPRDIAALVRNRREAETLRDALQRRGVASVFVSERDSVYASNQATDVLLWLQACANPASDRAMRAALASPCMGRRLSELDRLQHDEAWWEACGEQFRALLATWRRHGVLAMLHNLLHAFDVPARLLATPNGERALTNLQHLAELLQHAATGLDGEQALVHYLAMQMQRAGERGAETAEDQVVRLESEADLVQVVTIHKSKGLQYPVVMLPFLCSIRDAGKGAQQPWHDDAGQACIDLQPGSDVLARIERERLQEDLRLLYVALTRAEHALWLGIACTSEGRSKASALHRSAFGYVLSGGEPIGPGDLLDRLRAMRGDVSDIYIDATTDLADTRSYRPGTPTQAQHAARKYRQPSPEPWWIASYSAIAHGAGDAVARAAPETAVQDVLSEAGRESFESAATENTQGIHAFPRGAEPGTFLHGLLEWMAETGFADAAMNPASLGQQIARRCQRRGWQAWIAPLTQWLPTLLRTPLALPDGGELVLAHLDDRRRYQSELEFWFEANQVDTQQLDHLVSRHTLDGAPRPSLPHHRINGMLKGFVDLVVEHDGRYYVIDYKSNWLGDTAGAYTPAAMRDATLQSRYDLQYAIYTLALHRQLRARLPGYRYEQHMGGVLYLYLRGIDGTGHGVHAERLPPALIDAMDRLFAQGASHVA